MQYSFCSWLNFKNLSSVFRIQTYDLLNISLVPNPRNEGSIP